MHFAIQLCLFLRCLSVPYVKAAPTPNLGHLDIPLGYQNITTLGSFNANGSLNLASRPWGPTDFAISTGYSSARIQREAVFALAVRVAADEALRDFEGRLSEARTVYQIPQAPSVVIAVASVGPYERVRRKFLLWAIARGMDRLIRDREYRASTFTMMWQGRFVGRVSFVAQRPTATERAGLGPSHKDVVLTNLSTDRQVDFKAGLVGADQLSFEYQFWGELLYVSDIFMGTIGALIRLAELSEDNFDHFLGDFQGYHAIWTWQSSLETSVLTKARIVQATLATVMYAFRMADYHEVKVVVRKGRQEIARGGYVGFLPPPGPPPLSLAASSS